MKFLISRNGESLGEFSRAEIEASISKGALEPTDLFWKEGMVDWKPLRDLDFYTLRGANTPQGKALKTDVEERSKSVTKYKVAGFLMIVVGMFMSMGSMADGGQPGIAGGIGFLLFFGGFVVFLIGRMLQ
jgi:hypothetical protein